MMRKFQYLHLFILSEKLKSSEMPKYHGVSHYTTATSFQKPSLLKFPKLKEGCIDLGLESFFFIKTVYCKSSLI